MKKLVAQINTTENREYKRFGGGYGPTFWQLQLDFVEGVVDMEGRDVSNGYIISSKSFQDKPGEAEKESFKREILKDNFHKRWNLNGSSIVIEGDKVYLIG